MAIRYDKKLNQEINKTIRNFNQKIARLEKSDRDLILPTKITKKQLKSEVITRNELKRKLKELQRYSNRGIEQTITTRGGVTLSKYELANIKRESARVKRNLTREIKKLQETKPKVFGKIQATTFAKMGDSRYLNLVTKREALNKDLTKISSEQFERQQRLIAKIGKNQRYMNNVFKDNYFEMLTDLGYYYNYDEAKLREIKNKIYKLSPEQFYKLFNEEKSIKAITEYYGTRTGMFVDPDSMKDDVKGLYDALYENIDDILKDYNA